MFSVGGKKRLLLDLKRAKTAGIDVSQLKVIKQKLSSSNTDEFHKKYKPLTADDIRGTGNASPTSQASTTSPDSKAKDTKSRTVFSTKKILRLLHSEEEEVSAVMTKLLDGTVRYRPDKDALSLKPFESAILEYDLFRSLLRANFELAFNDHEYSQVIKIFDKSNAGHIDGFQFIIAFIKLCSMRKDRDAEMARKKQAKFMKQMKKEEIQKQLEIEKRQELKVNFDAIDGDEKSKAISKFNQACKDFDPAHPQSPSLDGLLGVPFVRPAELREIMKATFKLALSNKELGAILLEFQSSVIVREKREAVKNIVVDSVVNDAVPTSTDDDSNVTEINKDVDNQSVNSTSVNSTASAASLAKVVPLGDFIKFILKRGMKLRDKERLDNIKRQEELNNKARELAEKKQLDLLNKGSGLLLDFNYSELDQARAEEKLVIASTKYDKNTPGCPALDGFMCEHVTAGMFKELMKNVFNAKFNNKELAYLIKKYQVVEDPGKIPCSSFLTSFLKIGIEERHKHHLAQLEKKRQHEARMHEEHVEKMNQQVVEAEKKLKIDWHFSELDLINAVKKLTVAAMKYDKSRGASLMSFDPIELSPAEFKAALFRTFNLKFSPKELGALVCKYESKEVNSARNGGSGSINCKEFLNAFMQLGINEKFKHQVEQIKKQKEAEEETRLEHKRKIEAQNNKTDIEISYDYNEDEETSAISKMTIAATKYDKNHPSALDTSGFEVKSMPATLFKEMVRRTFGLRLTPTESGAILHHLHQRLSDRGIGDAYYDGNVNCGEFLIYFLSLGIEERAKAHKAQLDKQVAENKKRQEDEKKKLDDMILKPISIDKGYTQADIDSITMKLLKASEGFDKNHPAAPSLISFDAAYMTAGQLKENMKRTFNVKISPKELAYLMAVYDPSSTGQISCGDFLIKFLAMGKEIRDEKHKLQVQKQRDAIILQKKESEDKINAQREASELKVDWDYTEHDKETGREKLVVAAAKYDKSHASAPSTAGFTGGAMKPGEFNNLLRRTFNLWLTGKELATIVHEFKHADHDDQVDSKLFLVKFMKLGFDERARRKASKLDQIRTATKEREIYLEKKKKLSESKTTLHVDRDFFATDKASAYRKLTIGATLYDRNSPGCASLDAFNAKYLTPGEFREQLKRTFNIALLPKELAAIIDDFCNGGLDQNVQSQQFLNTFLKLGSDERDKKHRMELTRQRREESYRKNEHERAMKAAEDKMQLKIDYNFDNEQKNSAFEKLNIAAKRYDKNSPGCLSLDGFTAKELNALSFKEMLKRTFGMMDLTAGELGALMSYYDTGGKGVVSTKDFLISFLQMGINQRDKEKRDQIAKNRSMEELRKKEEEDKLQAQWAKLEIDVSKIKYNKNDINSAMEKLEDAATKFDAERAGPTALTAFDAKTLSIAVFREMLKRVFNLKVNDSELAYIAKIFSVPVSDNISSNASVSTDNSAATNNNEIVCKDFLNKFLQLGIQKRHEMKMAQLEKQRRMIEDAKEESVRKKLEADKKLDIKVDDNFTQQDYNSGMGKLRQLAANYQRGHPSAPSLDGFTSGGMLKPDEFRFLILRTFNETLSNMELSALVRFYDSEGQDMVDSNAFLTHFLKMQRLEQDKKRKEELRILRNREKQAQVEEDERVRREQQQEIEMIKYNNKDEASFIEKLRNIAQEYTVDSAVYNETLSAAFKGPSLNAKAFRQIILRVFNVKFTFPEIGVLLSVLDKGGSGTIDGQYFLNWFYKFCRKEQRILLGEIEDDVSIQNIRSSMDSVSDLASVGGFKPINSSSSTTSTLTGSYTRSNQVKVRDANSDNISVSSSQSSFTMVSSRSLVDKATNSLKTRKSNKASYPLGADYESQPEEVLTSKSLKSKWVLPTTAASMSIIDDDASSIYGQQFRDELSEIMSLQMPSEVENNKTNKVLPLDIYNDVYGGGMDRDLMSVDSMSTLSLSVSNLSSDLLSSSKKPAEKKKIKKELSMVNPAKMIITPLNSKFKKRTDDNMAPGSSEEFFQKPKPEPKPMGITQKIYEINMLREKKLNRGGSMRSNDSVSSSSVTSKSKDLPSFFLPAISPEKKKRETTMD